MERWYRYQDVVQSPTFSEDHTPGELKVHLFAFFVLRRTPKGVWLNVDGESRFVRVDSKNQWASPTREKAMANFRARKQRQIAICLAQADRAQRALGLLDER